MRRNLVIALLVLGIAATAAWYLAGRKVSGPANLRAPPGADETIEAGLVHNTTGTKPTTEAPKESKPSAIPAKEGTTGLDDAMGETPEAKHEAYVAKRVVELQDLGMEDDSASLDTILSELSNGDPEIRQAAVDAAVQFGSHDAIPRLTDAAAQTDDPREKSAILDAIEFLKLPTLTEALKQKNQPVPVGLIWRELQPLRQFKRGLPRAVVSAGLEHDFGLACKPQR